MPEAFPLISIVIVNWNGERFLPGCLNSIFSQPFKSFEVIIVDNGSKDKSVEIIRGFPEVLLLENKENTGFAAGNNRGINAAKGKYILTLNNDTILKEDFFEELVKALNASGENAGMLAPKILSMEDRKTIDSVGGLLIYPDGLAKGRGRLERDENQYDETASFIPSACAGLYRKDMLAKIGAFDEDFFAYCEDTDLGLRARLSGYDCVNVPKAVVYHHYSGTGGKYTPFKAYLAERNHFWVAVKNFPLSILMLYPLYSVWRYIVQTYGVITGKGAGGRFVEGFSKFELIKILVKSEVDAIKKLPVMVSRRRAVQKSRKAGTAEVRRWFREFGLSASGVVLKD